MNESPTNNIKRIAQAIESSFTSPNVSDTNLEPANLVDVFDSLARAAWSLGEKIHPGNAVAEDASGVFVGSLTEAVGGVAAGLVRIAEAIEYLADKVELNIP